MIPHIRIEELLHKIMGLETMQMIITAVKDEKKGEKLVVLHLPGLLKKIDSPAITKRLKEEGLPNLWIPREYIEIEELPLLVSGKLDLRRVNAMAEAVGEKQRAEGRGQRREKTRNPQPVKQLSIVRKNRLPYFINQSFIKLLAYPESCLID